MTKEFGTLCFDAVGYPVPAQDEPSIPAEIHRLFQPLYSEVHRIGGYRGATTCVSRHRIAERRVRFDQHHRTPNRGVHRPVAIEVRTYTIAGFCAPVIRPRHSEPEFLSVLSVVPYKFPAASMTRPA